MIVQAIPRLIDLGLKARSEPTPKIHRANGRCPRTAHSLLLTVTALPDPMPRSNGKNLPPFSAADGVMAEPKPKTLFIAAIEKGFANAPRS